MPLQAASRQGPTHIAVGRVSRSRSYSRDGKRSLGAGRMKVRHSNCIRLMEEMLQIYRRGGEANLQDEVWTMHDMRAAAEAIVFVKRSTGPSCGRFFRYDFEMRWSRGKRDAVRLAKSGHAKIDCGPNKQKDRDFFDQVRLISICVVPKPTQHASPNTST